jgi:hypothetical protein
MNGLLRFNVGSSKSGGEIGVTGGGDVEGYSCDWTVLRLIGK